MTNVAVWYIPKVNAVWAVADARVSGGYGPLTDMAVKILPLRIRTHRPASAQGGWAKTFEGTVGFCYAGSVLPALLTHAALNVFLENLGDEVGSVPPLKRIADLCGYVSSRYLREINVRSSSNVEYIVFGRCTRTSEFKAFHIRHTVGGGEKNQYSVNEVPILKGEVALLGVDVKKLRDRIQEIRDMKLKKYDQIEPRLAIEERLRGAEHETVGGTLQFGIANVDEFRTYATTYNEKGGGAMQYLGFNLSKEIEPKIGSFIKMTGLI